MADRIVAMKDGVAQQIGPPAELYDNPANYFVASFIGSPAMNFLAATLVLDGRMARVTLGDAVLAQIPAPAGMAAGGRVTVGLRPERLEIVAPGLGLAVRVDLVEPTGLGQVVHLRVADQRLKLFTTDRRALAVGEAVGLTFHPSDVLLFHPDHGERLASS